MILSDKQLQEIEEFGNIALPLADVAIILMVPEQELAAAYAEPDSQVKMRYCAGFLRLKASLRKSISDSALQGSNPAQNLMQRYIDEIENKDEL